MPVKVVTSGVDVLRVNEQTGGSDDFFAAANGPATDQVNVVPTPAPVRPASQKRWPRVRVILIATCALALVAAALVWWQGRGEVPLSPPPPHGGALVIPETLGGIPRVPEDRFAAIRQDTLAAVTRDHPGVRADVMYYLASGQGMLSLVLVQGPVNDLGDRKSARDIETFGLVQCGNAYVDLDSVPEDERQTDWPVCWRTSGHFSLSVFAVNGDRQSAIEAVNEAWEQQ